jgi:AAA+ ATPase superfamily predicted ATPase
MNKFIGRQEELKQLSILLNKNSSSLVVVTGRRRIGKSRLIQEFGKKHKMYKFSGSPPTHTTTRQSQLEEFGWQLGKNLDQPAFKDTNWNDLFLRLAASTKKGRVIILFDEISWIGSKDPDFLGKLKNAWDLEFSQNPQLILILCGSVSTWIEKNILSSTGFLGRISLSLKVQELPLKDLNEFWGDMPISVYEKFKILSVTGGVPKYLEEVIPKMTAEENIQRLCFTPSGFLFKEFDQIFSDLFQKRSKIYKQIVESLITRPFVAQEIYDALETQKSGVINSYLQDLCQAGFIKRNYTWNLKEGAVSKLSQYSLCDNYLRFYLKYINPIKAKIEKGPVNLQSFESIMGLQFENMVLNNRQAIFDHLNISFENVINDGPFFQFPTKLQKGCQVDYLIQTRFGTLYVCEIKFSKHPIGMEVVFEMKQKIKALKIPKHISCRPVLIQVNGVTDSLKEEEYFANINIIDFSNLLMPS